MEKNPLLEQENYAEPYNVNIEKMKNQPEVVLFDKLCYEVFEATEMGREFIKFISHRFLINSQVTKGNPTYQLDVIWQEGFRDAYRMILNHIQSHKQRIQAGTK